MMTMSGVDEDGNAIVANGDSGYYGKYVQRLNDEGRVRGVTVFRGIAGFGKSGEIHSSSLLDMSLDLPVAVEFFDEPDKAQVIINELYKKVGPGHITSWLAQLNVD